MQLLKGASYSVNDVECLIKMFWTDQIYNFKAHPKMLYRPT